MTNWITSPATAYPATSPITVSERLITKSTTPWIDLDELKKHLRFTSTSEDTLLDLWALAAAEFFELETDRALLAQTWEYWLDGYPDGVIEIPKPPLIEIVSLNGDAIDADAYEVDAPSGPYAARGLLKVAGTGTWPTIATPTVGAVKVRFRAGYGEHPSDVPPLVKAALLMMVGHFHKFRAETVEQARGTLTELPIGAATILRAFRFSALPVHPVRRWQTV